MTHLHFGPNEKGEDYVVGDIHGCFSHLMRDLDSLSFDPSKDRVFCVGDLIDRGQESHRALEFLDKPWFHSVRGNHEQLLVDSYEEVSSRDYDLYPRGTNLRLWQSNGGYWAASVVSDLKEFKKWNDRFKDLPLTISVDSGDKTFGVVHAEIPGNSYAEFLKGLEKEKKSSSPQNYTEWSMWSRHYIKKAETNNIFLADPELANSQLGKKCEIHDLDFLICGHTPLDQVGGIKDPQKPFFLGNRIYIDRGVCCAPENRNFITLKLSEL